MILSTQHIYSADMKLPKEMFALGESFVCMLSFILLEDPVKSQDPPVWVKTAFFLCIYPLWTLLCSFVRFGWNSVRHFPNLPTCFQTVPAATSAALQNDNSELLSLCWSQCPWHHGCVIVAQDCTADRLIFGARWSDTPVGIFPENNHCLPEDCGYFVCFLYPEVNTGPVYPL